MSYNHSKNVNTTTSTTIDALVRVEKQARRAADRAWDEVRAGKEYIRLRAGWSEEEEWFCTLVQKWEKKNRDWRAAYGRLKDAQGGADWLVQMDEWCEEWRGWLARTNDTEELFGDGDDLGW